MFSMTLRTKILQMAKVPHIFVHLESEQIFVVRTRLICRVIEHIKDLGYQRVSIGVDATDAANIRLYKRLGFTIKVKECIEDPCNRDENMQPRSCPCFWLLYKEV